MGWNGVLTFSAAVLVANIDGLPRDNMRGQSLVGRFNAVIDCRTEHDSYFADPDDCRMFYHCSDWAGLEHKSCGALFFHPQKKVCDWPRIVRRVRHDCPTDLEDTEAVTEVISIVGADPNEAGDGNGGGGDEPTFDDGSFFTFVPEERHRFRLSTPAPRKPSKMNNKKFFISTTTSRQQPAVTTAGRRVPFVVAEEVVQRPRLLQVEGDSEGIRTFKSLEEDSRPRHIVRAPPTKTLNGADTARQIERTPVTIVKTLPSRNIVKSLPVKPPPRSSETTRTTSRRPQTTTSRARKVLQVPSTHRFSGSAATKTASSDKAKKQRLRKEHDEANEFFHAVKKAALSEEQRNIKLLLEQAKVDGKSTETSAELHSPVETTTTTTVTTDEVIERSKSSSLEFKSPEERPDFLGVVKKKAEKFKEILKVIKENSTLTGDQIEEDLTSEEVRELEDEYGDLTYAVRVVTSTSSTLSKIGPDEINVVATTSKTTNAAEETAESVTEPSTTTTASTTRTTAQAVEGELALATLTTTVDNALEEREDDYGVHVVHAAPHVTRAEPLVQGGGQEGHIEGEDSGRDTSHSQIDENALQESRIHETVAEEHAHEHHRHGRVLDNGGEGHPTSVDMLMSLFDHLDLGAIMHHLSEEDADEVENTDQEDLTTAESTSTIQTTSSSPVTTQPKTRDLEVKLVRVDTAAPITTVSTTPSSPSTEEDAVTTTATTFATTTTTSKVSTKGREEDKVHVVLPEGYTTKGSPPERSTTKPPRSSRKSHPLSTTVTTTGPARNTFSMPEPVYTATETTTATTKSKELNDSPIRPFDSSTREKIRAKLRSEQDSSTFEVLEAINSKTLAEARAATDRESRAREMALKALAAKEALFQRLRATSTTTARPTTTAAPIPEDSLVDRRKVLFSQRATTKRPTLPKGKAAVLTAEQAKKQQILEEIRRNKQSPRPSRPKPKVKSLSLSQPRVSSLTERLRPSLSILSSARSKASSSSASQQPNHRRPKTVSDLLRSSQAAAKRQKVGEAAPMDKEAARRERSSSQARPPSSSQPSVSAEEIRQRLRCKLMRGHC